MPLGNTSQGILLGGNGVTAQYPRQAGEPLPSYGIALVRHGAGTFLARGEKFFDLHHFRPLDMPKFCRPMLDAGAHQRERADKLRVQVALNYLCRNGCRPQSQSGADFSFDPR